MSDCLWLGVATIGMAYWMFAFGIATGVFLMGHICYAYYNRKGAPSDTGAKG